MRMKLRMIVRGVVDREMREVGATMIVNDPAQIDAMLRTGTALPADVGELAVWRGGLPRPPSWMNWRR